MTTDKEKFEALIAEFGLHPTVEVADGSFFSEKGNTSFIFEKPQPKVVGYASSVAIFTFKEDGSFKEVGVWE